MTSPFDWRRDAGHPVGKGGRGSDEFRPLLEHEGQGRLPDDWSWWRVLFRGRLPAATTQREYNQHRTGEVEETSAINGRHDVNLSEQVSGIV